MHGLVPMVAKPGGDPRREVGIDEQAHWLGRSRERQLVLLYRVRGELQRCENVSQLQVGVVSQYLFCRAARGELAQHRADRHSGIADTRQPAHPARVDGDPLVRHVLKIRADIRLGRSATSRGAPPPERASPGAIVCPEEANRSSRLFEGRGPSSLVQLSLSELMSAAGSTIRRIAHPGGSR